MWSRAPRKGVGAALVELAHGQRDRPARQASLTQLHRQRAAASLKIDLGDAAVLFGQIGQGARLVQRDAQRLFDKQVQARAPDTTPRCRTSGAAAR